MGLAVGEQEPLNVLQQVCTVRAPCARYCPVHARGPTTEKANIKQINGKRGRRGKEQRESKITPNTTALMPLGVCLSSCASPMYFFHFKCFPFMFTSVPTLSLRLFSRAFPLSLDLASVGQSSSGHCQKEMSTPGLVCQPLEPSEAALSSVTSQARKTILQSYKMPHSVAVCHSFIRASWALGLPLQEE